MGSDAEGDARAASGPPDAAAEAEAAPAADGQKLPKGLAGQRPPCRYAEGKYTVKVIHAAVGKAGNGTPLVELLIQPLARSQGASEVPVDGPVRYSYLYLTDSTMGTPEKPGWVFNLLVDLGFVGPSIADLLPLIGKVREATMKARTWRGTSIETWTVYQSAPRPTVKKEMVDEVPGLDSKFAGFMARAARAARGGKAE